MVLPGHEGDHWNRPNETVPMVPFNLESHQIEGYKHLLDSSRRCLVALKKGCEIFVFFNVKKTQGGLVPPQK